MAEALVAAAPNLADKPGVISRNVLLNWRDRIRNPEFRARQMTLKDGRLAVA